MSKFDSKITVIISKRLRPEQFRIWVGGRIVVVGPGPGAMARAEHAWRHYLRATEASKAK